MPRAKRPLAEVDANAGPASKKVATGSVDGKENLAATYTKKTVPELSEMLKERSLPHTGKKADLVDRLVQSSPDTPAAPASESTATEPDGIKLEFVTMCRPPWDISAEKRAKDDEYDSDQDDEADEADKCGTDACMCEKPAANHPDWKWMISKQGLDHVQYLAKEQWKRDQDAQGEYIYNDFSGYGFQELIENELAAMDKLLKAKDVSGLWSRLEAWAAFVPHSCGEWFGADDGEGIAQTLKMMGNAVIGTLTIMQDKKLLVADSRIPDIALVLAQLRQLDEGWPAGVGEPELAWANAAIYKAKRQGVVFKEAPYGIEKAVVAIEGDREDGDDETDEADTEIRYKEFNWKKEFAEFKRGHSRGGKFGGTNFVLVKEKKKTKKASKKGGSFAITLGPGEDINDFL